MSVWPPEESGWLAEQKPCEHPGRPTPGTADVGRVWYCLPCKTGFEVEMLDHGHDVMPGERSWSLVWRARR